MKPQKQLPPPAGQNKKRTGPPDSYTRAVLIGLAAAALAMLLSFALDRRQESALDQSRPPVPKVKRIVTCGSLRFEIKISPEFQDAPAEDVCKALGNLMTRSAADTADQQEPEGGDTK